MTNKMERFFLKSIKAYPDGSDLFKAKDHESVSHACAVLQECLHLKPD